MSSSSSYHSGVACFVSRLNIPYLTNDVCYHRSVGDMSDGTLDEYLDFCQDALLGMGSEDDENTGK